MFLRIYFDYKILIRQESLIRAPGLTLTSIVIDRIKLATARDVIFETAKSMLIELKTMKTVLQMCQRAVSVDTCKTV